MSQSVEQMTWEELAGVHVSPQTAELDYLLEWIEPVLYYNWEPSKGVLALQAKNIISRLISLCIFTQMRGL